MHLFSELLILLIRQTQPDSTTPHPDPVFQHLASLKVRYSAAVFCHFDNLRWVVQVEFSGQGGFQIRLKELAIPALTLHEVHIDTPAWRMSSPTILAGTLSGLLRRVQPLLAPATNLSRQSSSCRRSPFSAHGGIVSLFSLYIRPSFQHRHFRIKAFKEAPKAPTGVPIQEVSVKLRPWFLATVSVGLVAIVLRALGESPEAKLDRLLDEALDPDREL